METSYKENNHHILVRNRESLEITGISKIDSLNDETFVLETIFGQMIISGSNLEMRNLNIDKGELFISGQVNVIEYHDKAKKKNEGIMNKLFK